MKKQYGWVFLFPMVLNCINHTLFHISVTSPALRASITANSVEPRNMMCAASFCRVWSTVHECCGQNADHYHSLAHSFQISAFCVLFRIIGFIVSVIMCGWIVRLFLIRRAELILGVSKSIPAHENRSHLPSVHSIRIPPFQFLHYLFDLHATSTTS